jgi:hypothetical protein
MKILCSYVSVLLEKNKDSESTSVSKYVSESYYVNCIFKSIKTLISSFSLLSDYHAL